MHTWKKIGFASLLAAVLLLAPAAGWSQEKAAPQPAKLDELVADLVRNNPEILAATARYSAALALPSIEGSLPDPKVSFGWMSPGTIVPGKQLGVDPNANINLQVEQEFPYPGKRGLKADVARREADNAQYMQSALVREKIAELKQAYYDLALAEQTTGLLKENQDALREITRVAESRYSVGKGMQQDIIKAGTEVSILQNRLLALDQQKQSLSARINTMLNRPATAAPISAAFAAELPPLEPLEALQSRLKQNAPMLLAQQSMINSRQLGIQLAQKDYYPDFDVMTGYYYQGKMPDMFEFRVGVSIPIFYKSKQRKEVEQATGQLIEARQNYRATEQTLAFRLQDAYVRAQTARNLVDLYQRQIVPQSRLALESSLSSYQTGGVDFLTVFSNFTTILDYRMNLYEQQAEYMKALATLEELTAVPSSEARS